MDERKDWTTFSAQVGEIASDLTINVRANVAAVVVDESLSRQLVASRLRAEIPADQTLLTDSVRYSRGPITLNRSRNGVTFIARLAGMVVSQVDGATLRERLAGLSLEDAHNLLETTAGLAGDSVTQIEVFSRRFE